MTFRFLALVCLLGLSLTAAAQNIVDDSDWKEGKVPPPPAFNAAKLLRFDVSSGSTLVYGVDPASLSIGEDGIVRYVLVASSSTGARNVLYEGLRCSSGEFKTYARYMPDGNWTNVEKAEWRSMFGNMPSRHALQLARAGACNNSAPASSVGEIVRQLKNQGVSP
ncbi:CNP1-like family protein [Polaromonas sp.]|uniref:CNP1-like family protein n=1 Tax=Polaromonas sp. TaxID=1869339 RepID=UPI003262EC30